MVSLAAGAQVAALQERRLQEHELCFGAAGT